MEEIVSLLSLAEVKSFWLDNWICCLICLDSRSKVLTASLIDNNCWHFACIMLLAGLLRLIPPCDDRDMQHLHIAIRYPLGTLRSS